jgi:prepilin-type N-terminal cleavage/methylation domain-containing protein
MLCTRNNTSRYRGFTLIEVLVSLTLMTLIGAVVISGLRTGMETTDRGSRAVRSLQRRQTVLAIIEAQVRSALPMQFAEDTLRPQRHVAFEGDGNRLRLISNNSLWDGPDGIPRWIELDWNGSSGSVSPLLLREFRILPPFNTPQSAPLYESDLLTATRVEFAYLRRLRGADLPRWLDAWKPENVGELPAAVRIRIEFRKDDSTELLIPLETGPTNWQGLWLQ